MKKNENSVESGIVSYCYPNWQIAVDATIKKNPLSIDFLKGKYHYRQRQAAKISDVLAKAVGHKLGIPALTIIDATAGLAMDGFMLASLGCEVTMVERNPILALLVHDAIYRYKASYTRDISLSIQCDDAKHYLATRSAQTKIDVVYLDPMYPQQHAKTALNQAGMRIIRQLVGNDDDIEELFQIALQVALKRVVVKRPQYASYLANVTPSFSIGERGQHRFDIYLSGGNK